MQTFSIQQDDLQELCKMICSIDWQGFIQNIRETPRSES